MNRDKIVGENSIYELTDKENITLEVENEIHDVQIKKTNFCKEIHMMHSNVLKHLINEESINHIR